MPNRRHYLVLALQVVDFSEQPPLRDILEAHPGVCVGVAGEQKRHGIEGEGGMEDQVRLPWFRQASEDVELLHCVVL